MCFLFIRLRFFVRLNVSCALFVACCLFVVALCLVSVSLVLRVCVCFVRSLLLERSLLFVRCCCSVRLAVRLTDQHQRTHVTPRTVCGDVACGVVAGQAAGSVVVISGAVASGRSVHPSAVRGSSWVWVWTWHRWRVSAVVGDTQTVVEGRLHPASQRGLLTGGVLTDGEL